VYKWIDEQGVTHYSGSPPPETVTEFATLEFPSEYELPAKPREVTVRCLKWLRN